MKRLLMIFTNPLKGFKLILIYSLTLLLIGLILFLLLTNKSEWIISYFVYAITAIIFAYSVYTIIISIPRFKQIIIIYMEKRDFTNKLIKNYKFRTIVFAVFSFSTTIIFALFQAFMGIINSSIWFGALASYYIVLSLMRGNNLYKIFKMNINEEGKSKLYRNNGYMLVLLTFIFSFAVVQMVLNEKGFEYIGMMIYVFALYTFYKITLATINIFKARKQNDFNIQTIRNINLADALVSIVALQTAMFHSFGTSDINTSIFNALTGGIVCILIIIIGITMIIQTNKYIKKRRE